MIPAQSERKQGKTVHMRNEGDGSSVKEIFGESCAIIRHVNSMLQTNSNQDNLSKQHVNNPQVQPGNSMTSTNWATHCSQQNQNYHTMTVMHEWLLEYDGSPYQVVPNWPHSTSLPQLAELKNNVKAIQCYKTRILSPLLNQSNGTTSRRLNASKVDSTLSEIRDKCMA